MESFRMLSVYKNSIKLTKQEKIEYAMIMLVSFIMAGVTLYFFTPAFAISNDDIANLVKTIVKVICFIAGALFLIAGIVKYAISHANEDGPAQQKAIMMIATGAMLVALGGLLVNLIQGSWFQVDGVDGSGTGGGTGGSH